MEESSGGSQQLAPTPPNGYWEGRSSGIRGGRVNLFTQSDVEIRIMIQLSGNTARAHPTRAVQQRRRHWDARFEEGWWAFLPVLQEVKKATMTTTSSSELQAKQS